MKIEGYEEITEEEYAELPFNEKGIFNPEEAHETHYFKKAQKFPICFENEVMRIQVTENGIEITDKEDKELVFFNYNLNFPLLVKAVEKAKEVMEKKS